MSRRGFSQAWESSQHLRAARLEADIDWLFSVIGDPGKTVPVHPAMVPFGLQGFAARLQHALGLHTPAK